MRKISKHVQIEGPIEHKKDDSKIQVGIDIERVVRFREFKYPEKMFTEKELEYFQKFADKAVHMAGTFCAKEAVSKAIKKGLGKEVGVQDIEILHDEYGAPYVNDINGKLEPILGPNDLDVSIAHSDEIAVSTCILY